MERVWQLILVGLGALVLAGLAMLAMQTNAEQDIDIDEAELAKARAKNQVRAPVRRPEVSSRPAKRTETSGEPDGEDTRDVWQAAKPGPGIPQPRPANAIASKGDIALSPRTEDFVLAMDETNKLYDRGDYEGAVESAMELLKTQPNNVRMIRVAISSHCILGNHDEATTLYQQLPARDQRQMMRRCRRYGVEFE